MPDPDDTVLRELAAIGLGRIFYPGHPGCAGSRIGFGGTPAPCTGPVTHTARHWYRYPRPAHWATLRLCRHHARLYPDARNAMPGMGEGSMPSASC